MSILKNILTKVGLHRQPNKSKQEIIKELFDDYFCLDTSKRAFDTEKGMCTYFDSYTGNRCAFGMCMLPSDEGCEYPFLSHGAGVYSLKRLLTYHDMSLDDVLKEEYHGHGVWFWNDVQNFHDQNSWWTPEGLSDDGKKELEALKTRYSGE
jgi:hypothetical protein